MPVPDLARIEKIEPRAVWTNEAGDFTPWLARDDNLALLAKTIGIELEFESSEKFIGPFRADIVCRDISNHLVLIENQLERTDHTHLGQLLTYGAGLDAVTVIWVATYFTDEHRAALDWLNRITQEGINFFGVEIEVWRIADSPLAPNFKLVCQPNEWSKTVTEGTKGPNSGGASDREQLLFAYWSDFRNHLGEFSSIRAHKPSAQNWMEFAIGRTYFTLEASVRMTVPKHIRVGLRLSGSAAKVHYSLLCQDKEAIERNIAASLDWRELPDKQSSYIDLVNTSVDPTDSEQWPQQHEWLRKTLEAFDKTFRQRIMNLTVAE